MQINGVHIYKNMFLVGVLFNTISVKGHIFYHLPLCYRTDIQSAPTMYSFIKENKETAMVQNEMTPKS